MGTMADSTKHSGGEQPEATKSVTCTWCEKPATIQLTMYKGTQQGWYCDTCYDAGLKEEHEAMYG